MRIDRPLCTRAACIAALSLAAALAGCGRVSADAPVDLSAGLMSCKPQSVARLYFGLLTPDGTVDDAAWQEFVGAVIAPRLAGGFTVLDAQGQWRGPDGVVITEASRVLEVVGDDDLPLRQALVEIVGQYKTRFRQSAVLVTQSPARACI